MNPTIHTPDGREVTFDQLKKELAKPQTAGIRQVVRNHPSSGLTPSGLARLLKESETEDPANYLALAEDMEEKEPQYASTLGVRKRAVAQLDFTIEPASDDPNDIANAELAQEFINHDCLQDEVFDILDSLGKGFSVSEIIWDMSEKQWMPCRLEYVEPGWFQFDRESLRTPMLKGEDKLEPLVPYKFVTHFAKAKSGIPIRSGLARQVAWCYLFKNFDIKSWVTFAEVYGQPIRLGRFHNGATAEEQRALLRAVSNIGTDAAAIIPKHMEIEFVDAKGNRSPDMFQKLALYMDHQISKVVLGQTTTTDAISGGHAVSKEHNEVRADIMHADAQQLAVTLRRDVIKPMIDLNRGPQKRYPILHIGKAEEIDLGAFAPAVATLVNAGLRVDAQEVRGKVGLKEPAKDAEVLSGTAPGVAPAPEPDADPALTKSGGAANRDPQAKAITRTVPEDVTEEDVIDDLVEEMLGGWEEDMDPVLQPVRDLVDNAESIEDIRDGLVSALAQMDESRLASLVARGGFMSRLAANLGADSDDDPDLRGDQ